MKTRVRVLAALLSAWLVEGTPRPAEAQVFSVFRYNDDVSALADPANRTNPYQALKYLPLPAPGGYLSLGGDIRERQEFSDEATIGARIKRARQAYDLQRLLVFGDLHLGAFRAFVQVGSHLEAGRLPGPLPTDVDRGDVQQAFVDYRSQAGSGPLTMRAGRAEMSFDDGALIGLRDGPNVRQVWDGARAFYVTPGADLDLFFVRPVAVEPGLFDDADVKGQSLWGVHFDVSPQAPFKLNGFYYGSEMPSVNFYPRAGNERSHTVGARLSATFGAFDGSIGAIGQLGTFAGQDVLAWSGHVDAGWALTAPWMPHFGVRGDVLSGGGANGIVHTFNALYPNYSFSTEAAIEAPTNLIQPAAILQLHPTPSLQIEYKFEGLWRFSTADAFYASPLLPIAPPTAGGGRFSGTEQQLRADWRIDEFTDVTAAYVHFEAGSFLRAAKVSSQDFGMAEVAVRF